MQPVLVRNRGFAHVSEVEAKAMWSVARKSSIRLLIKLLWFTGLRISEALNLLAKDCRQNGNDFSLSVTREKRQKDKKPEWLPVPRELGYDIKDYINQLDLRPSDKLFNIHRSSAWRQVRLYARKAGLENWQDIHPHSFRHGFVYDKVKKGINPYVLSRLAGHININSTLHYYHPTEADLRQAMEA